MRHSIYAVCGSGAVGKHPLDADAWSGSSRFFFTEIQRRGSLGGTIGGELPFIQKLLYALRYFSPNRSGMMQRLYTSTGYRNALSRLLAAKIRSTEFPDHSVAVQLGSMYNVNAAFPDRCRRCSYHDGNFAMLLQSPHYPKRNISEKMANAALRYEKDVLTGQQAVFTMSEFLRQSFIRDYGIAAEKVHCIGAGINLPPEMTAQIQQEQTPKDYSVPDMLFVGADFDRKGGRILLNAFRQIRSAVPKARLHIVGPACPVKGFEAEPGVQWHGFLHKGNPADMKLLESLFAGASLFVLPSLYEPFGIAPLEAMLHRIPCVVSERWALPEIVPAGKTGEHVAPGNTEELGAKITMLLKNPDKLYGYGRVCRSWVTENFLWHHVVDRLDVFLQQIFP
ncbi:MAG: glycosyltransferase family 4 protein [Planctomycetaceae bacterium]|jgi:glycosyltransferase involved in cell wall biosynthesis|nr:glycosyltransferase family 4 protein [Planctomycetaceae bacterium]